MVEADSETLFNAAAAATSTLAVLFFLFNVRLGYSPVTEVALVVLFLTGVFALTQRTDDGQATLLGYGVIVVGAVGLFLRLAAVFDLGDLATVVGLVAIAGALLAARDRLDEDDTFLSGDRATVLLGGVAALTVLLVVVDAATGGVAYQLQLADEVTVAGDREEQVEVGVLVAENPTPLPERVDAPRYGVCAAGNWSGVVRDVDDPERREPGRVRANVRVRDGYNEHLFGFSRTRYPVELHVDDRVREGATVPVERTDDCPDDRSGPPYLAVFERTPGRLGATAD